MYQMQIFQSQILVVAVQQNTVCFLLAYQNTVHAAMSKILAVLFMGRNFRSRSGLLKVDLKQYVRNCQISQPMTRGTGVPLQLRVDQNALAHDY